MKTQAPHQESAPRREGEAERLLRSRDVTRRLNISTRTFERLLSSGRFPRPDLRIGRLTLWKPATLDRWIEDEANRQGGRGGRA